jgi:hypothetical protein
MFPRRSQKNTILSKTNFPSHMFGLLRPFILGLTFSLSLIASEPTEGPKSKLNLPEKSRFHLYVLAGQSNMAGRGKLSPMDRIANPRIFMLDKNGEWKPATDPLHFDKPAAGVGLGRSFAEDLLESVPEDVTIGLIPTAAGGSAISAWEPGGYHSQTRSYPYDDAVKRIRKASESGTVKGILWHQGESDCTPERSQVYEMRLHELIGRFRSECNLPQLPFVAGQMGQFEGKPWNEDKKRVDQAHRQLPAKVPHTAFVDSNGLGDLGDQIHFSSDAYREFGKRYAKAMILLQNKAANR